MKKAIAMLLALTFVFLTLAGCSEKGEGPADGARTSLVLAESSEWWGMDTTLLDGSQFTQGLTADPLVVLDENGNMLPNIASEVSVSDDGKTITLTIPEGMEFSTGEQLEPEDVVASFARAKEVSPFATNIEPIIDMQVNGRDVIFTLSEYTSDIAVNLAGSFLPIQDKDVLESSTDDELLWGAKPYGMYYMTDYVPGAHIELTRNPGYITHNPFVENKGMAHVENVTVRFISEEFSMVNALNVDDVQVVFNVSSDGITQITREDADIQSLVSIPNVHYVEFNQANPILADIKVREALSLVLDREALVEAQDGMVIPAYSCATDKVSNHSAKAAEEYKEKFSTDVERAKQLLAEAGWTDTDGNGYLDKDGVEFTLKFIGNDGALENKTAQSLQIQYKEVGVNIEIELYANYYHYDEIYNGNYDLGMGSFGWQEPILLLNMLMCDPNTLPGLGVEEEYYDLVKQASHTVDSDARTELVYQIEKILSDNIVNMPLYTKMTGFVFAGGVTGIDIVGNGAFYFNDMK